MKLKRFAAVALLAALLAGCSSGGNAGGGAASSAAPAASSEAASQETGGESETAAQPVEIAKLTVVYVPSRPAEEIITATSGLKDVMIAAMAEKGYIIGDVEIAVSDNYNAAGEALAAGTADIGYIPGGTYALYSDDVQLLLTATRDNLTNDSTDPADWNGDENATDRDPGVPVTYYKGLIYAGPSATGRALAEKVNNGEALTWEEVSAAKWGLGSNTSNASYIYPNLWLKEQFDMTIQDLPNKTADMKQPDMFLQAAAEQIDIIVCYADGRMDYGDDWEGDFGRDDTIWNELNVIGVTPNIYNDSVCLAKSGDNADVLTSPEFQAALSDFFIHLGDTEEGQTIIGIYSHTGYVPGNDSDYDASRNALEAME
ncbi:MAG: PhnD/SsuA/transferrin family substrate-binding protein [Lachnospiraceae bacterium]|nr:PhnD/SsuA/transferrin family substrate-binding protein [Lachnospiraceae bacterium]